MDSNLDPATAFGKSLNFSLILDPPNWVQGGCERVPSTQQKLHKPARKHRAKGVDQRHTSPELPQRRSRRGTRPRGGA